MKTALFLAVNFLIQNPRRLFITIAAAIASTCIVLWIVSGYESVLKSHDLFAEVSMGRYDLSIDAVSRAMNRQVMPQIIEDLKADPNVAYIDQMWAQKVVIQTHESVKVAPPPTSGSAPDEMSALAVLKECLMLATDAEAAPFKLLKGQWITQTTTENCLDIVVSRQIAVRFGVDVTDYLTVGRAGKARRLNIVGIIDNPPIPITGRSSASLSLPSPGIGGIYISIKNAETLTGLKSKITFAGIRLKEGTDINTFRFGWMPKLGSYDSPAQFQQDHDLEEQLDEASVAKNMKLQSYTGTALTMLLAFLIIFNTLNMGVSEQIRQFAMLRAITLTKRQVVAIIYFQALTIATVGFLGGLAVGALIIQTIAIKSGTLLHHGATIGRLSLLLALLATYGGALLAAIIPAWRSTRIRPLDAMSPPRSHLPKRQKILTWLTFTALLLIAPVTLFAQNHTFYSEHAAALFLIIGTVLLAAGFLTLTAPAVVLVEKLFGKIVAMLLRIDSELFTQQLSSQLWRTVASVLAMSVGLALFTAIQVWGYTLLENFVPGRWAPKMMTAFDSSGMTLEQMKPLTKLQSGHSPLLPVIVEQPRLRKDLTGSAARATVTRQDNVVVIGIDLQQALTGSQPALDFDYVQSNRAAVLNTLKEDDGCIVPEHFLKETGLKIGDSFELVPPENPEKKAIYKIRASVKMKGWHWLTKSRGLRVRAFRAAALVFASYNKVSADFNIKKPSQLWMRSTSDQPFSELTRTIQNHYASVTGKPVQGKKPKAEPEEFVKSIAQSPPEAYVHSVTIADVRHNIRTMAAKWLWAISVLPLIAMLIGALGVFNVVISSIETRRWELGVMRAVGFSRWTIIKVVTAEGLLIGLTASILSLGFGISAGHLGTTLAAEISFFGGMETTVILPVFPLAAGVTTLICISTLTALIPAVKVGLTKPMDLLRQGRKSF